MIHRVKLRLMTVLIQDLIKTFFFQLQRLSNHFKQDIKVIFLIFSFCLSMSEAKTGKATMSPTCHWHLVHGHCEHSGCVNIAIGCQDCLLLHRHGDFCVLLWNGIR